MNRSVQYSDKLSIKYCCIKSDAFERCTKFQLIIIDISVMEDHLSRKTISQQCALCNHNFHPNAKYKFISSSCFCLQTCNGQRNQCTHYTLNTQYTHTHRYYLNEVLAWNELFVVIPLMFNLT